MSARGYLMLSANTFANTNVQPHCLTILVASGRQATENLKPLFFSCISLNTQKVVP